MGLGGLLGAKTEQVHEELIFWSPLGAVLGSSWRPLGAVLGGPGAVLASKMEPKSKNIDMSVRGKHQEVTTDTGMRVRAISGDDSSRLRIKIKQ